MSCTEFPSASPADVRGPQAVDLCGVACDLLADCSPLKTPNPHSNHTHTQSPHESSMPIICQLLSFQLFFFIFSSPGCHIYKVIYMFIKFGVKARFGGLFGKTGVQLTLSHLLSETV